MPANQAPSTPPTTAASSDQMMQDGTGKLWTSLGQSLASQMACMRLLVFRSEFFLTRWFRYESYNTEPHIKRRSNDESEPKLENSRWLGAARAGCRNHAPGGFRLGPRPLPACACRAAWPVRHSPIHQRR